MPLACALAPTAPPVLPLPPCAPCSTWVELEKAKSIAPRLVNFIMTGDPDGKANDSGGSCCWPPRSMALVLGTRRQQAAKHTRAGIIAAAWALRMPLRRPSLAPQLSPSTDGLRT